ncbi:MAG: dynamin family protein [Planctomycetaceae bacterium]|jgi:GTPase Era involved in 16S rRNA processing|nr:dynamin family protein [Planctomycetaceae bacterium]
MTTFQFDTFHTLIDDYTQKLPSILERHAITQKFVSRVKQGLEQNETPFTVAVVGQMRVGKSSLLNTLVKENLAVVGVTETTATINWFKYATKEQCNKFRVVWKDQPEEELSLDSAEQMLDRTEKTRNILRLEFFADAEFLKHAYLVDTPGTRSVLDDEETIQDFITKQEGEKADAMIYVLPPIARETDEELLKSFEQNSRIPGAAPYNSVAVMHKWETINSNDPYQDVKSKVERIKTNFKNYVADVLPVSAPMGWACEHFDDGFWRIVFEIGNLSLDVLKKLFFTDQRFLAEFPDCSISAAERKQLRQSYQLPWATFKFIINRVSLDSLKSPEELKTRIDEISGIRQLHDMLEMRFFSRAKMIRRFGILAKTLPVCDEASITLRNHRTEYNNLIDNAEDAINESKNIPEVLRRYVQETRRLFQNDLTATSQTLSTLDALVQPIKDVFEEMNNDVKYLDKLDLLDRFVWSAIWKPRLAHLFGQFGVELKNRIASFLPDGKITETNKEVMIKCLDNAIAELKKNQSNTTGETKHLLQHAVDRIGQIADQIEAIE